MNDATRARIVRGWLILAAVIVGWLLCPSWWWLLPVALFMPPLSGLSCGRCSSGTTHQQMQLVFSGITDQNFTCDCPSLDGTYVVDLVTVSGFCMWNFDLPVTTCDFQHVRLVLDNGLSPPGVSISTAFTDAGVSPIQIAWFDDIAGSSTIDCNFSAQSVPVDLPNAPDTSPKCSNVGATCDLTAL